MRSRSLLGTRPGRIALILGSGVLLVSSHLANARSVTNNPPVVERRRPPSAPVEPVGEKQKQAEAYERSGQPLKAAELYEELLREDPARNKVLVHRLVKIHAAAGHTAEALRWAKTAAQQHPDPRAMMAGVHVMLGDPATAVRLLQIELKGETQSRRLMTLNWQLASIYEKMGTANMAEKHLRLALKAADSPPFIAAAEKRLTAFMKGEEVTPGGARPESRAP